MSVVDSVSRGDEVAVVEDEEVVVEGEVTNVFEEDEGWVVEIEEGESSVIEYWEKKTGARVTLQRMRNDERWRPIPVANIARLEYK